MERRRNWDAISIAAAMLCGGPELVTNLHLGLPPDLRWWEWLTVVPIAAALLGTPQLTMLAFVRATRWQFLRVICVIVSGGMLALYYYYLRTGDLTSSSTAVVGLFFLQFYMAIASAMGAGVLMWVHGALSRGRDPD